MHDTDAIHELRKDHPATKSVHMPAHIQSNPTLPPKSKPKKTKKPSHATNLAHEVNSNLVSPTNQQPAATISNHMQSPSILRKQTKAHANHANFITNLPKPTMVPTTLNPMNHSAISFLPWATSTTEAFPA